MKSEHAEPYREGKSTERTPMADYIARLLELENPEKGQFYILYRTFFHPSERQLLEGAGFTIFEITTAEDLLDPSIVELVKNSQFIVRQNVDEQHPRDERYPHKVAFVLRPGVREEAFARDPQFELDWRTETTQYPTSFNEELFPDQK